VRSLALLLALSSGAPSEETPAAYAGDRAYASERFGLEVEVPDDSWTFYADLKPHGKTVLQLAIFPRGSPGVPSVTVYVSEAGSATDATLAREGAAKTLEAQGATDLERGTGLLGGSEAPELTAKMQNAALGLVFVRCLARIEHGFVYSFLCARSIVDRETDEAVDAKFRAILSTAKFPEPQAEVVSEQTKAWRELAERCASDLAWAETWPLAAARAKDEGKLVFVLFQNHAPLDLPDTLRTGALMDPDFASLLDEGFVVLRLGTDDDAPFRDPKAFGMSKHAFGTAYLVVDPDGKLLAECGISDASFLDEFVRGVLEGRKQDAKTPVKGSPLERASERLRRGELAAARKALGDDASALAHRLRAAIFRRERNGKGALDAIRDAKRVAGEDLEADLACDEAVLLMRLARYPEAQSGFERVAREWPDHARAREAEFWLGAFDFLRLGRAAGTERWTALAEKHGESPWAWKAAANLLGEGCLATGAERLDWPEPDLVRVARKPKLAPPPPAEAAKAEKEAIAWLVRNQREDGSWWNPDDGFSLGSNLYTPACSAICGAALLAHLGHKGARAGAEKLLGYALDQNDRGRLRPSSELAGVYSIWNRTFVAWTIARALDAGVGDAKTLAGALQELVDSVLESQDRRGGWPYVRLGGDPGGPGIDPSASFLTAGVVLALLDAQGSGAKVAKESIERALDFLEKLRASDGTFRYLPDIRGTLVDGVHTEACGRGPLCALALRRGGRGDGDLLEGTLDLFLEHRSVFKGEWHKELCHTSPEGFGSHYLFYDYLFAARAVGDLPRESRPRYRAALLADILDARLEDGSFQDMPGLGRPYATAMASLALQALEN